MASMQYGMTWNRSVRMQYCMVWNQAESIQHGIVWNWAASMQYCMVWNGAADKQMCNFPLHADQAAVNAFILIPATCIPYQTLQL